MLYKVHDWVQPVMHCLGNGPGPVVTVDLADGRKLFQNIEEEKNTYI